MAKKKAIYNLPKEDLSAFIETIGESKFRVEQIWKGLYKQMWTSWDSFTNLPYSLRKLLDDAFSLKHLFPSRTMRSQDNSTQKVLFELVDSAKIESVLIQHSRRNTLCISCQSGCGIGCAFCATGSMGLTRNLDKAEIIEQVLYFARFLEASQKQLTNIVVMGMGEPFMNYLNTMGALKIINNPEGLNFGARRITISTIGILPNLYRFLSENIQINLAISLHAPNNKIRNQLVPINEKYPIDDLFLFCKEYTQKTHRRISFEYILIDAINDSLDDANELSQRLNNMLCHVNLIPYNPSPFFQWKRPPIVKIRKFQSILRENGIPATIRASEGIEIQAGCGQLTTS